MFAKHFLCDPQSTEAQVGHLSRIYVDGANHGLSSVCWTKGKLTFHAVSLVSLNHPNPTCFWQNSWSFVFWTELPQEQNTRRSVICEFIWNKPLCELCMLVGSTMGSGGVRSTTETDFLNRVKCNKKANSNSFEKRAKNHQTIQKDERPCLLGLPPPQHSETSKRNILSGWTTAWHVQQEWAKDEAKGDSTARKNLVPFQR